MSTLASSTRAFKPTARRIYPGVSPDVELLRPVCYPCTLLPHGQPGMVRINATVYLLQAVAGWEGDELVIAGYRFTKSEGEVHDVEITRWGMECTCGDGTFRQRVNNECKHRAAVRILRERGELV